MQLVTKHFGEIEVEESGIITFPEGIPGFEKNKKFVLLGKANSELPFQWLQNIENTELAFVVINPLIFKPDYDIDVDDSEVKILDIKDVKNILLYSIVVVPENISQITANLKAPILINTENNKAKQVIIDKADYSTKHYIMEEVKKSGGAD